MATTKKNLRQDRAAPGVREPGPDASPEPAFPVVGVGASAGGLEALTRLLEHLPAGTGMAFVLVQHLAAQHPSMLVSLLGRTSAMPVMEVRHGTPLEPNRLYVIPPNTLMSVTGGVLELKPRPEERGAPRPIDCFFRSLALDRAHAAIGVILSGADSDGALGLQAIRDGGGIAIVQSADSAKHSEMPRFALAAGPVDLVLPPEEIAAELQKIARRLGPAQGEPTGLRDPRGGDKAQLNRILALAGAAGGIDFRGYKLGTIRRRIHRRMILRQQETLEKYASCLESDREELTALCEELLINVTSFFRDPELFRELETEVFPRLIRDRSGDSPIRIWVPGCSTGEEVYSIAMCMAEATLGHAAPVAAQIFGTDISERGVEIARGATYPVSRLGGLSPERQQRFLTRVEDGYQVVKSLREMCVFARQNLIADPPFSRLDLISCRNVLIYLGPDLQRRAVKTFHYALRPKGYLILGRSERLAEFPGLFTDENKENKIYTKTAVRAETEKAPRSRGLATDQPGGFPSAPLPAKEDSPAQDLERAAERIILSTYAPPWVVANEAYEIIHSRGDTSPYFQLPGGRATLSLLKMARDSIRRPLRTLLEEAHRTGVPVQSEALRVSTGGAVRNIRLEVRPISDAAKHNSCYLVLFCPARSAASPEPAEGPGPRPSKQSEVERLREELHFSMQRLQAIIDERDSANQDLISANEEIQSSNEELQSINEELETSKEELQASNEELNTINEELQNRNQELIRLGDDLANLLSSTTLPILMLDGELRVRRMTPAAEHLLNVHENDIGRRIGDIRLGLSIENVEPVVRRVLAHLSAVELELQDSQGRSYTLQVRPYRTTDNRIAGAVLVLIDIDQMRRAEVAATAARKFAEAVVESVQTPLLVLGSDLRIRAANRAFLQLYRLPGSGVEGRFLLELGGGQWSHPAVRAGLAQLVTKRQAMEDVELEQEISGLGRRTVSISARPIQPDGEDQILLAIDDITAQRRAERVLLEGQELAESALHASEAELFHTHEELRALAASLLNTQDEERRRVSRELHDELSQRIAKLQFDVETIEQQLPLDLKDVKRRLLAVRDQTETLSNDVRRIAYQLHPSTLDNLGLSVALRSLSREFASREGIPVHFAASKVPRRVAPEVASSLYRVVQEALRNVVKHAGKAAVTISLTGGAKHLRLSIRDDGIGFDKRAILGGGGLGLISMQERVRLVEGEFSLETRPGHGVRIMVRVPIERGGTS